MKEQWQAFIQTHSKALLGATIGFVCAVLLFSFGFWKTVLLGILVMMGICIGIGFDRGETLPDILARWWLRIQKIAEGFLHFFRRMFNF